MIRGPLTRFPCPDGVILVDMPRIYAPTEPLQAESVAEVGHITKRRSFCVQSKEDERAREGGSMGIIPRHSMIKGAGLLSRWVR